MSRGSTPWIAVLLLGCSSSEPPPGSSEDSSEDSSANEDPSESSSETGDGDGDPLLPGECASPLEPVEFETARLQLDAGGVLRDPLARAVVMRGLNTGNRNKTAPYVPFPITDDIAIDEFRSAADEFFAPLRGWGMDTVRLPLSWAALEPERDVLDQRYLDRYEAMVDAAWSVGLRVIVDVHQDVYAEQYCGDGFPNWSVIDPNAPAHRCPDHQWGLKYLTSDEVRGSFDRFWANEDQLVDEFHAMWTTLADRLADHPGVVALEILNEPGWGSSAEIQQWKLDVLTPFHDDAIVLLQALAPDLLIVYDNPGIDSVDLFPGVVHPRPTGDNLIYGPHLYGAAAYGPDKPDPGVRMLEYAEFGRTESVHVLLGEFGFQPQEVAGPEWLTDVAESLDLERMSATIWEYSYNDPLWNYEDFSMVDAAGNERVMLDAWVRPWLRAVSGTSPSFEWDATARTGSASWVSAGEITEIVVPLRLFGADGPSSIELEGDQACFTLDMDRGELRVIAPAGNNVNLDFAQ